MKMKTPTHEDAETCISIRKRSKRGETLSREDRRFVDRMFRQFPEWYGTTEVRVFNETAPLGSNIRMTEDGKIVYD